MRSKPVYQFLVFWLSLLATFACYAQSGTIPLVKDLGAEAQEAADRRLPILLLFTTEHCEFCELIKSEYLLPMQNNPDYANRVMIREVPAGGIHYLRDFDGTLIGGDSLALRYGADLIPTVVFIDSQGRRLGEPLVGITSRHYYDRQLDEAISRAWAALRGDQG